MPRPQVLFKKLHKKVKLPEKKSEYAAAFDVYFPPLEYLNTLKYDYTWVECIDFQTILPNETKIIPLGFKVCIPEFYELKLIPRSGLGSKGIIIPNSPGTIDSDYRGEVGAILHNLSKEEYIFHEFDRICQVQLQEVLLFDFVLTRKELPESKRGSGGFGSTGR